MKPEHTIDGKHVGTVDHVEGDRIKLSKSDPAAHGKHQYIEKSAIHTIKNGEVCLSQKAEEALRDIRAMADKSEATFNKAAARAFSAEFREQ